ncbi:polyol transporter 5-like [Syzygium oleosum]|uniref:polyol transporter 5-like n=1 Tax=Syzygium oleosum TaxID=219896 RepID=UPI0024B9D1D0|nr:polyol transporter 5-like [Syzygium oleosum]
MADKDEGSLSNGPQIRRGIQSQLSNVGFACDYTFLVSGLAVSKIDVDYTFMIAPVYIIEISSVFSRGFFTSFPEGKMKIRKAIVFLYIVSLVQVFFNVGTMLATSPSTPSPSSTSTSGVVSSLVWEQSPWSYSWSLSSRNSRWLILQGCLGDTKHFLARTFDSKKEAALRLANINEASDFPKECNEDVVKITKQSAEEGMWREDVWRDLTLQLTRLSATCLYASLGSISFNWSVILTPSS